MGSVSRWLRLLEAAATQVSCLSLREAPEIFGPTDINAQTGNQGLSVALNGDGTVTVFRWPRPSFYEQIKHRTTSRDKPRLGAAPNAGSFLGLAVETVADRRTLWLRTMRSEQRHAEGWTDEVVTEYSAPRYGLSVTVRDVVAPDTDTLVRAVTVDRREDSPVESVDLVAFENFNLVASKEARNPVQGWCKEAENTDSAAYRPGTDAIVHVTRDTDRSTGERRRVAAGMAFVGESSGHQVGSDAHEIDDIPDRRRPRDAYEDATDGALSGNDRYAGQTTGALARPLTFVGGTATATVVLAAGETGDGVVDAIETVRDRDPAAVRRAKRDWLTGLLGDAPLPDTEDAAVRGLCRRALVTLVTNYDPESGAIVASIASQSPYALDWPRDGAYFNHALSLLGLHDWVEKHNRWYADLQSAGGDVPAGNWAMNYYADGVVGGPVPWEIDETGYTVWTLWEHYRVTGDREYLEEVYPAIRNAASFLADYRDPETGLHRRAYEDDNLLKSQTATGAGPVYLALDVAADAARAVGADGDAERWEQRRDELGAAIENHLWHPGDGAYTDGSPSLREYCDTPVIGPILRRLPVVTSDAAEPALRWPVGFEGERMEQHLEAVWEHIRRSFREPEAGERREGLYETQGLLVLARAWHDDPDRLARIRDGIRWVAHEHATANTNIMGEVWIRDGNRVVTSVSQPHTWAQLLFYYAALEAFPPGNVDPEGGVIETLRARAAREGAPVAGGEPEDDGTET